MERNGKAGGTGAGREGLGTRTLAGRSGPFVAPAVCSSNRCTISETLLFEGIEGL
jgi:hypothetical protein